MCGIFAQLLATRFSPKETDQLLQCIDRRGPDYCSPVVDQVTYCGGPWLKLKSSVLHLRGDVCQRQPVIDMHGNILMFNGQVYEYSRSPIEEFKSDTTFLADKLQLCTEPQEIVDAFANIEGPFAFIYWHHKLRKLFYGRDLFGRKSLCILRSGDERPLIISSVADVKLETDDLKWYEVSCSGIHFVDFSQHGQVKEFTYLYDLDAVYPKTDKCEPIASNTPIGHKLPMLYLKPLNDDQAAANEFDGITKAKAMEQLESKLLGAVSSRYGHNKDVCLDCRRQARENDTLQRKCNHTKVAVAFSGGIDSTLIAMALDKILDKRETIDLITVAFSPGSPDRDSVRCAFKEIRKLAPHRTWRLVLCDITKVELQHQRETRIRDLILPCDSVFDDGIGCACWFIGRGQGRSVTSTVDEDWLRDHFDVFLAYNPGPSSDCEPGVNSAYSSPASMLFVGSSIDEQLGGYSSHRRAWSTGGTRGLFDEVCLLMRRLSSRNLGRDDRVYSDHGRDLKLPFLDYNFVSFLNALPLGLKMNLDEPLDVGPKKILRELALAWGLHETGRRIKRAMQFGTRIANLEGTKERGDDVCLRLRRVGTSENKLVMEPEIIESSN